MLVKIVHETTLHYSDLIHETVMELRMAPLQSVDQHRLSFTLAIGPATTVTPYSDWLGNTVHAFAVAAWHQEIKIVATSVVQTERPPQDPTQFNDSWPLLPQQDWSLYDFLNFGGPIVDSLELRNMVAKLRLREGMSLGAVAQRVLQAIDQEFTYEKGTTNAASPITEVLHSRRGVCQDFSHLMIGMARALGIPARYVSGFLHPDRQHFRGYAQSHAWCELYFPSVGWIGFDPTNNCIVNSWFIKVAIGRDYRDVAPHKGVFKGNVTESMYASVETELLPVKPLGLAAERMFTLPVPVFPTGRELTLEVAGHQTVQQQQQHKKAEDGAYHQQQQQQQ